MVCAFGRTCVVETQVCRQFSRQALWGRIHYLAAHRFRRQLGAVGVEVAEAVPVAEDKP